VKNAASAGEFHRKCQQCTGSVNRTVWRLSRPYDGGICEIATRIIPSH